jgi:hypothetical protein
MPNKDHRTKVTLEDLLHLKRAERPPIEFWNRFESELRQKQLAALVNRRPWWQGLPQFLSRRTYLPIGATAVLAFTVVSVKYYFSGETPQTIPTVSSHAVRLAPATVAPTPMVASFAPEAESPAIVARTASALSDRLPDRASELTPWSAPRAVDTPSAKSIAASIARLEVSEPDLANAALGGPLPVATSRLELQSGQAAVELVEVSTVASKRSRLLAQLEDRRFTPEPQAPELVRERLARRLADSDFNDRFSRVGLEGGGVSLKF